MQLEHSFTVPVGIDAAWKVLLDIEQVAPCMPGAALETVTGDDFTGSVKVKVGPIGMTYKGKASFIEKDEGAHRAVIDAQGKDSRGAGTAAAKVTATLVADGDSSTRVDVITDLNVTGKPAQFGRGVMVDVGNKLIGQFADCLAGKLAGGPVESSAAAPAASAAKESETAPDDPDPVAAKPTADAAAAVASTVPAATDVPSRPIPAPVRTIAPQEVEPIDLMASAGPAVLKRLAPVGATLIIVLLLLAHRRSRRSHSD
jgi:carbon monoxide dehydrogenase subunit G